MLAKQWIAARLADDSPLAEIEISSRGATGRPRIWCKGAEQPWSLSISHTEQGVLVALGEQATTSVGVDLTRCEPLAESLVRLWFTSNEIDWLRKISTPNMSCFLWAAKEALYKACNDGESFDPRQVEVLPQAGCRYRGVLLEDCRLQSWSIDGHIAAMATVMRKVPSNRQHDFQLR